jgi:methyl-accepting chemotaxis protein
MGEFFRYHGAWAPGVRLFRRIGFRAKALVISAAFVLPLAVLGWNYFADKAASIEFSAKERLGVAYGRSVMRLADRLQALRLADVQADGSAGATSSGSSDAELRGDLDALDRLEADSGGALGTAALSQALRKALPAQLPSTSAAAVLPGGVMSAAAPTDPLEAASLAALDLLGQSTDGSNLTLDPDIDTYYLMDATMFRLLPMAEDIVRLLRIDHQAAEAATLTPQALRQAIERLAELRMHAAAVRAGLDKAVAYSPALRDSVSATAMLDAVERLAAGVEQRWLRSAEAFERPDAAKLAGLGRQALQATQALRSQALQALDERIAARVEVQQSARQGTALLLGLSLLVALYLFTAFRKVLDGGLREVGFHINAMREGNLTTQPKPWGDDEAAQLMHTLRLMQASLRQIVLDVRGASDHIATASAEISAGSTDLSARTERVSAALEQSASAMEEMAATASHSAQTLSEASRLAQSNARIAQEGGQVVASVVGTMDEIESASRRIADIVGVIDGISFQTNLLALNAAVEAARAGETGRGFAVVAAEVRQLAHRAATSAQEIRVLISDSVDKVHAGARQARASGATIDRIVDEARRVEGLLGEVARGAAEQASGVGQTTQAVQDMDAATQQNAALVEQTAAAAAALNDQARALVARVATFQLS